MVLISLMGSIDTMMVGGIGTEAIAAVGLVGQPRMLMLCMFFAMNTGITAVVARRKGQGDREDANRTLRTSLLIIFLMSLVMTVVGQLVARPLMRLAGAKAEGKVVAQVKGEKIMIYKYKSKKNYHRRAGHRQAYTKVEITSIG